MIRFNLDNINNKRINKYAMLLADYQFDVKPIRGCNNHIPDILSRYSSDIPDNKTESLEEDAENQFHDVKNTRKNKSRINKLTTNQLLKDKHNSVNKNET